MTTSPMTTPGVKHGRLDLFAVSFVINLLALALPLALLQVYDRILPSQAYGTAVLLIFGVALAIVLESLLRYGRTALFAYLGERYECEVGSHLLEHLHKADISAVEKLGVARLVDDFRAVAQVRELRSGSVAVGLYEIPFVAVYIALVAYIGGWLVLVPVVLFVLALLMTLWVKRATETALVQVEAVDAERRNLLWSIFSGIAAIKARGLEQGISRRYAALNARYLQGGVMLERHQAWLRENASLLAQLSTVLIVIFGAQSVIDGALSTGALSACTLLAGRSIAPAMQALGFLPRLAQARVAEDKVQELLSLPLAHPAASASPVPVAEPVGVLTVRIGTNTVIINPGEWVRVVSQEAATASHFLAELGGLTTASRFAPQLDGRPLMAWAPDALRAAVCLVPRHVALVPGSLLDNLTLFDPRYLEAAHALAEALGLTALLSGHRHGLLTEVGTPGAETLDEGVCQRVALIRALVRQPRVLLLDHAGSGLDLDGQQRLAAWLARERGRMTLIMATAKPALVALAERELPLDGEGV